jgi:hypothetical protein
MALVDVERRLLVPILSPIHVPHPFCSGAARPHLTISAASEHRPAKPPAPCPSLRAQTVGCRHTDWALGASQLFRAQGTLRAGVSRRRSSSRGARAASARRHLLHFFATRVADGQRLGRGTLVRRRNIVLVGQGGACRQSTVSYFARFARFDALRGIGCRPNRRTDMLTQPTLADAAAQSFPGARLAWARRRAPAGLRGGASARPLP